MAESPPASSVPKAVLYYARDSTESCVARLTLIEKGYGDDEVDLKIVDLAKGENYSPSYLRLNPKATVPTLIVPLAKTLSSDVDSRFKAIVDIRKLVEFMDKSRSPMSTTNTTSSAPAPALAPATVAFSSLSRTILDEIVYAEDASPDNLTYANARDEASLKTTAKELVPTLQGRKAALEKYLADARSETYHASEKTKAFWQAKLLATSVLLDIFLKAETPSADLDADSRAKREEFLKTAENLWSKSVASLLTRLDKEITGPLSGGDQLSIADLHIAGWLATLIRLAGGTNGLDGKAAVSKLEQHVGGGFTLPKEFKTAEDETISKLAAFWDSMRERASWKKVYGDGLV
ncbi:uncharacterized protein SCHCODRAFT_02612356 [Schizophyllum commune H4-8]|uniref:uncharacterized protein n=1 Tax=Schizophyllum commune (strain H4-8 / FGSC 9210) TaxID=578458 RepID=UPI00215EB6AA|nr:uncharacterized protein SCHCODRAFT_02612356 [Schizophyllum commune H4-8]KAI5898526.1 hypothetical protein SCHCODRAFT_02612356 [Schizophyllum commune H4-8]